jgi:hypothetical protein
MRRGLSSVRKPGSKLTLYFGRDPGCADFPSRAVDAEILGVRCRVAAVADSFCCGLPVIRTGIFPRACWPNATCSGLPNSSRNTPRSCRSIFSGGYEQTHLSGIGHRLRPLVQLRPFRESGFRARVRRDVCRRKARHPSGMLRLARRSRLSEERNR